MIPVTVRELAALLGADLRGTDVSGAELSGADGAPTEAELDAEVTGLAVDSRQVGDGSLFMALPGEHVDGHDYVATAFARGAAAALTSRPVPGAGGPCLVVEDPLAAAGRLARDQVDRAVAGGLRLVAITGSAGKTSTKDLLAQVLEAAGPTVAPAGNLNNELGVPLTVCRIGPSTRFLVAEMGARGVGHIAYLCTIAPPQVATVLNVGTAHVGEFGSRELIAVAKGEIVEALPADGTAVLTTDDPLVWAMRDRTRARVVATSVLAEPDVADAIWATAVESDGLGRCAFTLHEKAGGVPTTPVRVQLGLSGLHQVANAVAAAALARALGVRADTIAAALAAARPRSRWRMELTERADGVLVVNDAYNANPESMRAALDTVAKVVAERPGAKGWAVLGDMLELGPGAAAEHRALGAYAVGRGITRIVAVGEFADEVAAGALSGSDGVRAEVAGDRDDAVRRVLTELAAGDVVLVKASRGLALDTVAVAVAAADPVVPDDGQGEGGA
jgi:UDP-N-acetylmuramoyl-tripeptide--D-alanyl-D-alanine ligase